jgi:PRTRC genetic system protein C
MALNIQTVERVFKFGKDDNKVELDDPNPDFTPEEVMSFYALTYPELTTASLSGPKIDRCGKAIYKFVTNFGVKG